MREIEHLVHLQNNFYEYEDRIRIRFKVDKGVLLDTMHQYETFDDGKWTPIVRFDCAHGVFHKDLIYPNGYKEKTIVEGIFSMKEFALYARRDLESKWESYKEWYFKLKRKRRR